MHTYTGGHYTHVGVHCPDVQQSMKLGWKLIHLNSLQIYEHHINFDITAAEG